MSSSTTYSNSFIFLKFLLPFSDSLLHSHPTLLYFRSPSCFFQLKFHKMNGFNPPQFIEDLLSTSLSPHFSSILTPPSSIPPSSSLSQPDPSKTAIALDLSPSIGSFSSNNHPLKQMEEFLKKNEILGAWGGLEWGEVNLNKEDMDELEIFFLKKEKLSTNYIY